MSERRCKLLTNFAINGILSIDKVIKYLMGWEEYFKLDKKIIYIPEGGANPEIYRVCLNEVIEVDTFINIKDRIEKEFDKFIFEFCESEGINRDDCVHIQIVTVNDRVFYFGNIVYELTGALVVSRMERVIGYDVIKSKE